MDRETLSIVITGHVDHGKSTLIGRLLLETGSLPKEKLVEIKKISDKLGKETEIAYLIDQFKEERIKDMTIDTTQIFFKTRKRDYIIIDCPGHLELIKNMITGATLAETAILIIDCTEGIMEQTRRHAYIISMIGIRNVIVVINKMDLVNYNQKKFIEIETAINAFLKTLDMEPCFILPISAKDGVNITKKCSKLNWYNGPSFLKALDMLKPSREKANRSLRLPVQDVYDIEKKRVLVGKILSGSLVKGKEILVLPGFAKAKIADIKIFGKKPKKVSNRENIGVTLDRDIDVKRGFVIVDKESANRLEDRFQCNIFWMSKKPLEINKPFSIRCATQEVNCIAEKIERKINSSTLEIVYDNPDKVGLNESAKVSFKTERPIVIEEFSRLKELGRFVIEGDSTLLGAGIIT
ncbi:MAG: GTP-binding protein [Candidatus Orphnella occulta]|nr:GTP-binding protein [Candidatus Orphnella occulta]